MVRLGALVESALLAAHAMSSEKVQTKLLVPDTKQGVLVGQGKTPQGLDLITGAFKQRPFALYEDGCGTNMYNIFTETISVGKSLETESSTVSNFVSTQREELSAAIRYSAEVGGSYGGFGASAKVSAAANFELNSLLNAEVTKDARTQIADSKGVETVAEMVIDNFDNKRRFATFNENFRRSLVAYIKSGYSEKEGLAILSTYGQFVPSRGLFGGYYTRRMVFEATSLLESQLTEKEVIACAEASIATEAQGYGFSASAEVEAEGCDTDFRKKLFKESKSFMKKTGMSEFYGGSAPAPNQPFRSTPDQAGLLMDSKLYPDGKALELRLLSEFLHPLRVSPLEHVNFRKELATEKPNFDENDFLELHDHLQDLIGNLLSSVSKILEGCNCGKFGVRTLSDYSLAGSIASSSIECKCAEQIVGDLKVGTVVVYMPPGGGEKERYLTFCDIELVDSHGRSIRLFDPKQSSTETNLGLAAHAIDDKKGGAYSNGDCILTKRQLRPRWEAKALLPTSSPVKQVRIRNRDGPKSELIRGVIVHINDERVPNEKILISPPLPKKYPLRVFLSGSNRILSFCEIRLFDQFGRQAHLFGASQSSNGHSQGAASHAIDGNPNSDYFANSCTHTKAESDPWWSATAVVPADGEIVRVEIYNRKDCCSSRLNGVQVRLGPYLLGPHRIKIK